MCRECCSCCVCMCVTCFSSYRPDPIIPQLHRHDPPASYLPRSSLPIHTRTRCVHRAFECIAQFFPLVANPYFPIHTRTPRVHRAFECIAQFFSLVSLFTLVRLVFTGPSSASLSSSHSSLFIHTRTLCVHRAFECIAQFFSLLSLHSHPYASCSQGLRGHRSVLLAGVQSAARHAASQKQPPSCIVPFSLFISYSHPYTSCSTILGAATTTSTTKRRCAVARSVFV